MTQNQSHHTTAAAFLLTLLGFYSITTLTIVESTEDVSAESKSSFAISSGNSFSFSKEYSTTKTGPLLTFLLKPVTSSSPSEPRNMDNNATPDVHKGGELYLYHKDNEGGDNNDSNVSSEGNSEREGLRYRREEVKTPSLSPGGSKIITTNWGTYEEQAPVVVQSESRTIDTAATTQDEAESAAASFSDEYQSRERDDEYNGPVAEGSISYEDYEAGGFEGRQFYPSRSGSSASGDEQQEQSDGYYRQKYFATTPKTALNPKQQLLRGEESQEEAVKRPRYPNRNAAQRPQYRQPQRQEEETGGNTLMDFVSKAKTFYDIFRAMNSAWKTIEDRYRNNGEGIFPDDIHHMQDSTPSATTKQTSHGKKVKTTKSPTTAAEDQQVADTQEKDENRARRSSIEEIVNSQNTIATTTPQPKAESSSTADSDGDDSLETESDLESSESAESSSPSSSSTAVAEGRYIKGDPLKGYYDFVITEGSYKFWAAFQVGTAILIIYSTFAAIYYSKVNPLVSDYDYIDYLGGGRSLSDDSDFVDTDAPSGTASADGSKRGGTASVPGGTSRSQQQRLSSAGWFDWLPHAGHTLRFILEAIDKGYNEE